MCRIPNVSPALSAVTLAARSQSRAVLCVCGEVLGGPRFCERQADASLASMECNSSIRVTLVKVINPAVFANACDFCRGAMSLSLSLSLLLLSSVMLLGVLLVSGGGRGGIEVVVARRTASQ